MAETPNSTCSYCTQKKVYDEKCKCGSSHYCNDCKTRHYSFESFRCKICRQSLNFENYIKNGNCKTIQEVMESGECTRNHTNYCNRCCIFSDHKMEDCKNTNCTICGCEHHLTANHRKALVDVSC